MYVMYLLDVVMYRYNNVYFINVTVANVSVYVLHIILVTYYTYPLPGLGLHGTAIIK